MIVPARKAEDEIPVCHAVVQSQPVVPCQHLDSQGQYMAHQLQS
jgi:hypothetical protein